MLRRLISILILVVLMTTFCSCKPKNNVETNPSEQETVHSGGSNDDSSEYDAGNTQSGSQAQPKPDTDTQTNPDTPVSNKNEVVTGQTPEFDENDIKVEDDNSQSGELSTPSYDGTGEMTYEQYNALTAEKQQEYFSSFESVEKFFNWYNAAKAEYEKDHPTIEIGPDGSIDLDKIENGK